MIRAEAAAARPPFLCVCNSHGALKLYHLRRTGAFIGSEHDAQRIDRILEMLSKINLPRFRFVETLRLSKAPS